MLLHFGCCCIASVAALLLLLHCCCCCVAIAAASQQSHLRAHNPFNRRSRRASAGCGTAAGRCCRSARNRQPARDHQLHNPDRPHPRCQQPHHHHVAPLLLAAHSSRHIFRRRVQWSCCHLRRHSLRQHKRSGACCWISGCACWCIHGHPHWCNHRQPKVIASVQRVRSSQLHLRHNQRHHRGSNVHRRQQRLLSLSSHPAAGAGAGRERAGPGCTVERGD